MAKEQLGSFMEAIAEQESGGDYNAVGPHTGSRYGRARGKYQIMETLWPGWAKEAGVAGASWTDRAAQERVARYKMSQYYERYGSWDLVAVAWFAGPGRANTAKRDGIAAVGNLSDVLGTSVAKYVETMEAGMARGPSQREQNADPADRKFVREAERRGGVSPRQANANPADRKFFAEAERRTEAGILPRGDRSQAETMAGIMEAVSERAKPAGGKVLQVDALFGNLFGEDSDPLAQYRPQERNIEED